jgi:threonine/homoserine/homoserine lactone efflux protein
MTITYFFIGLLAAVVGALPLGTTNVAVINTTIKENFKNALKIVYTAALAEIILVVLAISFNKNVESFLQMNLWLQYTIVAILIIVGIVLVIGKKECIKDENGECIYIKERRIKISKQLLGFILGLVNPTVLVYWILVVSFLNNKMFYLSTQSEPVAIIIFLLGVFIGKVVTLIGYGKFSFLLKVKIKNITTVINRVIGCVLICISLAQFVKLYYF